MEKSIWLFRGEFTIREVKGVAGWGGDLEIIAEEEGGISKYFYSKGEGLKVTEEAEKTGRKYLGKKVNIEYTKETTGILEHIIDKVSGLNLETPRIYNQIVKIIPLDNKN